MYLTCEDIIFIHTCEDIVFDNIFCPFKSITIFWRRIEASSDLPYKSLAKTVWLSLEILTKWLEIFGKSPKMLLCIVRIQHNKKEI